MENPWRESRVGLDGKVYLIQWERRGFSQMYLSVLIKFKLKLCFSTHSLYLVKVEAIKYLKVNCSKECTLVYAVGPCPNKKQLRRRR